MARSRFKTKSYQDKLKKITYDVGAKKSKKGIKSSKGSMVPKDVRERSLKTAKMKKQPMKKSLKRTSTSKYGKKGESGRQVYARGGRVKNSMGYGSGAMC